MPLTAGVAAGAALGLLVQLIAGVLGFLFGFRPGLIGLPAGFLGGMVACFAVYSWLKATRKADMELLEANQRRVAEWQGVRQMKEAHRAAMTVVDLWQHLPLREEPVLPQLRKALWAAADMLPERQRLDHTLEALRHVTVGVPADDPTAEKLVAQIEHADTAYRAINAEVRERIEHIAVLAAQCQRFRDEQEAIQRARQVSRQADAVLGMAGASRPGADAYSRCSAEDTRAYQRQLAAVQDAYRILVQDVLAAAARPAQPSAARRRPSGAQLRQRFWVHSNEAAPKALW